MNCKAFDLLLEKLETEWTAEERQAAESHAAQCPDCAMLLAMRREMRAMDEDAQLPDGFTASWKYAINAEAEKHMNKKSTFPWKRALAGIAAALVVGVGTTAAYVNDWGAGAPGSVSQKAASVAYEDYEDAAYEMEEAEMAYDFDYTDAAPMMAAGESADTAMRVTSTTASKASGADAGEPRESKIVRTVSLSIRTREYEADYEALSALAAQFDGRIDSRNTAGEGGANSLRWASFTMRIPTERLDDFVAAAKAIGSVSSYSESADDVSENYYDIESRLATQQAKLQRLTELMAQAEGVSDLVELEGAISDAQYWIDYYTGQLQGYDSSIRDSRVYLNLQEISSSAAAEAQDLSLSQRLKNALHASGEAVVRVLRALTVFLVAALPWFAALALLALLLWLVARLIRRRRGKRKD